MNYYIPLFLASTSISTSELPMRWDLSQIYSIDTAKQTLSHLSKKLDQLALEESLEEALHLSQSLSLEISQVGSYAGCLTSDDVNDSQAVALANGALTLSLKLESIDSAIDEKLALLCSADFDELLQKFDAPFALTERREMAERKLSSREEKIISSLSADGYHGYGELYHALIGQLRFPFQGQLLALSQLENKIRDADPAVREEAFTSMKTELVAHEGVFAQVLNSLAGFRLEMYKLRGWDNVLAEPLWQNRMQQATLDAIWKAINKHKKIFIECLKAKAHYLGKKGLLLFDCESPLFTSSENISFDAASQFIVEQFTALSPQMGAFATKALNSSWVEAEDRPGKRGGAFCTGFPLSKESRIFMTHGGTSYNLMTLAHELGHGFHNHVIHELSGFNQNIKMNVAESASTMAEQMVSQAALEKASSNEERLSILDEKVGRSIAFFLNLQARFLFETRFYKEREKGFVLPSRINELMEEAQRETFGDALAEAFPQYWIQKLHFYCTDAPFYNFPYTFGYLFSLGIYSRAKADPVHFEKTYIALLQDTGKMNVEDLARKHLNVDLTTPAFWEEAIHIAEEDARCYLDLLRQSHSK